MQHYKSVFDRLSSEPTVTFGIVNEALRGEVVGPMNPQRVHYGVTFASDKSTKETLINQVYPTLFLDWNKYRPDLPPWNQIEELVVADMNDDEYVEFTFTGIESMGTSTTGDLKTTSLAASSIFNGVDGAIIDKDEMAREHSTDTNDFKVTEELH